MNHRVDADSLATIVLLDKSMELLPEPIRMQPTIKLIIDFDEYVLFCSRYLETVDYLSSPTSLLKSYIAKGDRNALLKCFYMDMAYSVCKELHYAEQYNKDATRIIHYIDDSSVVLTKLEIEDLFKDVKKFTTSLLSKHMEEKEFPLPIIFRRENRVLWYYANVLAFYAMAPACYWSPDF